MFSVAEKRKIAAAVEKVLLDLKHPEMQEDHANFVLHVAGKEWWSFVRIEPNWCVDDARAREEANPWNEAVAGVARKIDQNGEPKEGSTT